MFSRGTAVTVLDGIAAGESIRTIADATTISTGTVHAVLVAHRAHAT